MSVKFDRIVSYMAADTCDSAERLNKRYAFRTRTFARFSRSLIASLPVDTVAEKWKRAFSFLWAPLAAWAVRDTCRLALWRPERSAA